MFFAREPNFNVEVVSSILSFAGEHAIIKAVLELPPSDSYKTLVSLLSR